MSLFNNSFYNITQPPVMVAQEISKWCISSIILFFVALSFGIGCIVATYEAEDTRQTANKYGDTDMSDNHDYINVRNVAVGAGAIATLLFTIATFCLFYTGMRYKTKGEGDGHMSRGGLVIAGWVLFCITFILNLVILVVAFDDDVKPIWPGGVWTALICNILSWLFMFGYSEVSRRTYLVKEKK